MAYPALFQPSAIAADFRFNKWGDTPADVIHHEGTNYSYMSEEFIFYDKRRFGGYRFNLAFGFKEGRLATGSITLATEFEDTDKYLPIYQKLRNELIKYYGLPKANEEEWEDETYCDDPSMWGFALEFGDLRISSSWNHRNSLIAIDLNNDDDPLGLTIIYLKHPSTHA